MEERLSFANQAGACSRKATCHFNFNIWLSGECHGNIFANCKNEVLEVGTSSFGEEREQGGKTQHAEKPSVY